MSNFDYSRFCNGKAIKTEVARKALVDLRGWQCEECKLTTWRKEKIPLQIHHKDGNHINNELDNLLLLCPNCHAQTENYAGRNKRKINLTDEEFIELLKDSYSIRNALHKKGIYYSSKYHYDKAHKLIEENNIIFKKRPKKEKEDNQEKILNNNEENRYCLICGKKLTSKKQTKFCSQECSHKSQQIIERPSREELKQLIRKNSFCEIGRKFGVSDNAIRKWCDSYNLPRKKSDIKQYSDENWKLL